MTTNTATTTLSDVLAYIANEATTTDVQPIADAIRQRQKPLMDQRAATVTEGTTGTLANITPKYLNGLSGTVTDVIGSRATFLLDEASTNILRATRQRRFPVSPNEERRTLNG